MNPRKSKALLRLARRSVRADDFPKVARFPIFTKELFRQLPRPRADPARQAIRANRKAKSIQKSAWNDKSRRFAVEGSAISRTLTTLGRHVMLVSTIIQPRCNFIGRPRHDWHGICVTCRGLLRKQPAGRSHR